MHKRSTGGRALRKRFLWWSSRARRFGAIG